MHLADMHLADHVWSWPSWQGWAWSVPGWETSWENVAAGKGVSEASRGCGS